MDISTIVPGQRWVSDSEPELGLGLILKLDGGVIEVLFPAAEETRCYAVESAPLRRVLFKKGEYIITHDGEEREVLEVAEVNGLLIYQTEGREVAEAELSDSMGFCKPQDRLFGAQVDEEKVFKLRAEALYRRHQMRQSPLRGFLGGRTDLIDHQLSIVSEVSKRLTPRVLLADEVGLGKTIEACMIMHRLHLTGRADRVLILLPEPLINQWFVELLRRFNMLFSIFDEERCASLDENEENGNPFLDSQLVIASVDFLAESEERAQQAREAGWDMLIVDEAHHLGWTVDEVSASYALVDSLATAVPSVLLLTATPQQLGPEGHFARLRLLDPERYACLDRFLEEQEHYEEVALLVERIQEGKKLRKKDVDYFCKHSARVAEHVEALQNGDESVREILINELLDSFGTGRVMFRNTRAALSGFPERQAHLVPIDGDDIADKVEWLESFVRELNGEKALVICQTKELAEEVSERLQQLIQVNVALFHEELTLIQRDRNAAYFAEEEGAQILICSEIGSEGRNFQFAHHLVLFDLPYDPDLLEQRIGRLDRIGQTETIHIHVPYAVGTYDEVLTRWYHEGLGVFETTLPGCSEIAAQCEGQLNYLWNEFDESALEGLIHDTHVLYNEMTERLACGQERLLELNSYRSEDAEALKTQITEVDEDLGFEEFMLSLLDHFSLSVEDLGERTYLLKPGNVITDAFPHIPDEGKSVTFDRSKALGREDMEFMSWDHPIARAALDLLLGSESGNSSFGVWETEGEKSMILETYQTIEVIAPASLYVDRFLPATPIRVAVDHQKRDLTKDKKLLKAETRMGGLRKLLGKPVVKQQLVPQMIEQAQDIAKERVAGVVKKAVNKMKRVVNAEIKRLKELSEINDHVSTQEIKELKAHRDALAAAMAKARLRTDAVRLIWKEPKG